MTRVFQIQTHVGVGFNSTVATGIVATRHNVEMWLVDNGVIVKCKSGVIKLVPFSNIISAELEPEPPKPEVVPEAVAKKPGRKPKTCQPEDPELS